MPINDDDIEKAKRHMFGDKADLAVVKHLGSGISETTRISLNIMHDLERLEHMPAPWTKNRDMIVRAFARILQRSYTCPGRDKPQCCQTTGDFACFPNWREREDPEWYAQAINLLLSQVNARITQAGPLVPALAADEAFELGCLFTEALIKIQWDGHAKRGKITVESASRGGAGRRKRPNVEITVHAVDALIAQRNSVSRAYALVAKQQGVTTQTIAKEYRMAKKQG